MTGYANLDQRQCGRVSNSKLTSY